MKVVITDCNFESFDQEKTVCKQHGFELQLHQCSTPAEVISVAQSADALLVQYAPITREVLQRLCHCKVVVRYGIGVDSIDIEAAKELGIAVCNVPDYGIDEVADHAAALALSLGRQLPYFDHKIRQQQWPAGTPTPLMSFSDMTFAIVGAGRIGQALVQRMRPFGFKFVAYDPFVSANDLAHIGIKKLELDELFATADVVSLHLPLIEATHHVINAQRLKQMKSNAALINTSRGGLVDTQALAMALEKGEIAFAGIDVFESEPMEQSHPLRRCTNAILTPHIAYYSVASVVRLQRYAIEDVARCLLGEDLRCRVC
ncbi:C-terminal binding protein [Echinimonas agarilytica]|uniref:C-terminal binding protein n=1 Tax=Echinimonas agarilytica TaxID=1215918 RepID=A0AA41W9R3_9GAMM|nr:C-terminal binding protein [Echinimonas agarilytica]MCM2681241.1 C-terminal binding protein [Echinimonas agarilytica]